MIEIKSWCDAFQVDIGIEVRKGNYFTYKMS